MQKLIDISELSEITRLKRPTLYKLVSKGTIPFIKLGSRVLFSPDAINDWIRNHEVLPE